jgi:type VI secretion system protein ImpL
MGSPMLSPMHVLPLLALCLFAFALLWWFVLGARRRARRRQLRRRIAALRRAPTTLDTAPTALLQSIAQAREALQPARPARAAVDAPLYRVPWFLFLGDAAADVAGLLDAAQGADPPPHPARADAAAAFWRWRRLPSMVAIEIRPAVVDDAEDRRERILWHEALLALTVERPRLPLNGIVLCVDAASLAGAARETGPMLRALRRLIDEAAEHLRLQLPVYLVVTGLDQLPGYDTLRAALPAEALAQALGHRLPAAPQPGASAGARLAELFDPLMLRLHALRMALLREAREAPQRQAVHGFVEQLRALRPGLELLVQALFDEAHGPRPLRWRGLYFVAAGAQPAGPAFVADLFRRFLPADQPLART